MVSGHIRTHRKAHIHVDEFFSQFQPAQVSTIITPAALIFSAAARTSSYVQAQRYPDQQNIIAIHHMLGIHHHCNGHDFAINTNKLVWLQVLAIFGTIVKRTDSTVR